MKSSLFPFLSKFLFNCDQEENSNFIPRLHENLAGRAATPLPFYCNSTTFFTASFTGKLYAVYWRVLGDKSCSSSFCEWVSRITWEVWPGAELAHSLCPTSPGLRAQLFASFSALLLHPAPLVMSQAMGKRWQDKTFRVQVAIFAEVWLSHHFHIKAMTRKKPHGN